MCDVDGSALPADPGEARAVRAIIDDLGLPGIVDVHTHFMPQQVMRKVWGYFDRVGERGAPWPITYRHDEQVRLDTLRGFGVQTFSSLVYPHKPEMAQWLNGWAAEFAARTPDCLHSATFYPEPSAADYVPAAIASGARIFKSHIQVGGYDPRDPLLEPVWSTLEQAQVPVVIHAGSGPEPGPFTGPEPVAEVLRRHPDLVLIIAHMGVPEYREFLDIAERHPSVRMDTTMVFTDFTEVMDPFPRGELPRLRDLGDRILFGSDFPNIPYRYRHAIESLIDLDLGDEWLSGVLHGNARALFG
ncbi:amidohydrolase family protein [Mycolicibacterium brumae]|uniref:Amidohydrolase n=1 Tax=Mycolicibacterium brumae TaxID=85968 RepID=A0A2G5PE32_9MYCO|nr:amidohydrolase family protein [Mycolicibacterium brumae]MCV7192681.1 amidohydrolase [Mycolicibacterium brumae]PIB76576.1 amidohydrolase [Mycolicibacterium brumae]RWA23265.1 hypothetical protein MBRU_00165 [Mycolicibacterium brumae DSM 44177]UWW08805.1 amidohydrolase [Mycolicibacterium brumae]